MTNIRFIFSDEKGFVLYTVTMFLAIFALMGAIHLSITATDIKSSGNYNKSVQALYAAKAGIEEARSRLKGKTENANYAGDPASNPDSWWCAYILTSNSWQPSDDPAYNSSYKNYIPTSSSFTSTGISANSLQSNISYFVKIRHKREYDAQQAGHTAAFPHYHDGDGNTDTNTATAPGNIIYYGYGDSANPTKALQFTTSSTTEHKPVEIVTAYGTSRGITKIIEVEIVHNPGPKIDSAIYAQGDINGNGMSIFVDGNDECGASPGKAPFSTMYPAVTDLTADISLVANGNPSGAIQETDDFDITAYINSLKSFATELITADGNDQLYGSLTNFVTCYSDTSNPYNVGGLKLMNVTGFGILMVEGDLTLGGGFNWNGIIIVTGVLNMSGGGDGVNVQGSILAKQAVSISGNITIKYDSCMAAKSLNAQPLTIVSWMEV